EKPQPSLKCQSFQAAARRLPVESMPRDSSLPANWLLVTLTIGPTLGTEAEAETVTAPSATTAVSMKSHLLTRSISLRAQPSLPRVPHARGTLHPSQAT